MSKDYLTDDYAGAQFKPHGRLEIVRQGDIIFCHAEGPFNVEAVVVIGQVRRAGLADRGATQRAMIVEFHTSMLMSPEAFAIYAQDLRAQYTQPNPLVAIAWVVALDVEGRSIMLPAFSQVFSSINFPWQAFEDLQTAKDWIEAKLAQADNGLVANG